MTSASWIPEGWMASLDTSTQVRARDLIDQLARLGAPDAEEWAYSEIMENIPQLARFLVLRRIWSECVDTYRDKPDWIPRMIDAAERDPNDYFADAGLALKRLIDIGASESDIGSLARFVAYEAVSTAIITIDEGYDPEVEAPGWALVETDAEETPTGRAVGGLHESLLSLDPTGREGRPS